MTYLFCTGRRMVPCTKKYRGSFSMSTRFAGFPAGVIASRLVIAHSGCAMRICRIADAAGSSRVNPFPAFLVIYPD